MNQLVGFFSLSSAFWELLLCLLEWYEKSEISSSVVVWWYFEVNFDTFQWNSITFLFESFRSLCNFSPYSMFVCVCVNEKNFKISRVLSCIICLSYLIYCILSEKEKKKPRHFLGKIMCTLRRITTTFNFILEKWKKLVV